MFDNWTFARRLAVGFGLAGFVLLLIATVSYRTTEALIKNDEWVAHTHEVRYQLAELFTQLKDAETGQRGYIITGDETYLEPYTEALANVGATLAQLRRLTADNPGQQQRLAALTPAITSRIDHLKDALERRRTAGLEAAVAAVITGEGKTQMDEIRALIGAADRVEASLLTERAALAARSAAMAEAIAMWGGFGGAILIGIIGWFISAALTRQVGSAVEQMQSSSAELQAAANQQATGAKEQATAMNEVTTTMNELLATSRQIALAAQQVTQIADQTATAARAGHGTVETTHESIMSIRRQVDQIVSHMLELGKKSQEIGSVLDIVAELSEQTNILAINATIEASGAGEAGRRFAVVADEIRKLADRVGGSTKEIRGLIEDVRGAVNTTIMATETGSKTVDAGSRQFGEVAVALKQIGALVGTTTEAAREIELSTKQQSTAVEQVNVAVANVAQASKENEISSGQTLQTASQLAALSQDLLRIVRPRRAA